MEHRSFNEDDVASALAALKANRGNAKKTARDLGISRTTLRSWAAVANGQTWSGGTPRSASPAVITKAERSLAEKWFMVANECVDWAHEILAGGKDGKSIDVRNMLLSGAIATDKHQLLVGGPTVRSEILRVSLVSPDALRSGTLKIIEGTVQKP